MIPRRLSDNHGMTLIEALVAMTMVMFVFGATLTAFDAFQDNHKVTEAHNAAQNQARVTTDRLARDLRNLASPTELLELSAARPNAVERAEPFDLIFRTVREVKPAGSSNDANVMRVRYCLNDADPQSATLVMQRQTWTDATAPAMPAGTGCPAAGWDPGDTVLSTSVTNKADAQARPVFTYNSSVLQEITRVRTELYVDPDALRAPSEARLATAVLLRNQNQYPVANIKADPINVGTRTWWVIGSGSSDPEGQTLTYQWYLDPPTPLPDCDASPRPTSCIDEGMDVSLTLPLDGQTHTVGLAVSDPSGLTDYEEVSLAP
jgi:type II secretory pathway pseudopilin PulG